MDIFMYIYVSFLYFFLNFQTHTQSQIKEQEFLGIIEKVSEKVTEGEVPGTDHTKRNEVNASAVIKLKEVSKSTETFIPETTVQEEHAEEFKEPVPFNITEGVPYSLKHTEITEKMRRPKTEVESKVPGVLQKKEKKTDEKSVPSKIPKEEMEKPETTATETEANVPGTPGKIVEKSLLDGLIPLGKKRRKTTLPKVEAKESGTPGSSEVKKKPQKSQPHEFRGKKPKESLRPSGTKKNRTTKAKTPDTETKGIVPTNVKKPSERKVSGTEIPNIKGKEFALPKADVKKPRRPGPSVAQRETGKPQPRKFRAKKNGISKTGEKTRKPQPPKVKAIKTRKSVEARKSGSFKTKKRTGMKGRQTKGTGKPRKPGSSEPKKKTKKSQPPTFKGKKTRKSVEALFKPNKTRKSGSSKMEKGSGILRPSETKETSARKSDETKVNFSVISLKPTKKNEAGIEIPLKKKRGKPALPKAETKKARRPRPSAVKGKTGKSQPLNKSKGRRPKSKMNKRTGMGGRQSKAAGKARETGSSKAKKNKKA